MIPFIIGGVALAAYVGKKLLEDDAPSGPSAADLERAAERTRQEAVEAAKRKEANQELQNFLNKHGVSVSAQRRGAFVSASKDGKNDPSAFDHEYGQADATKAVDAKIDTQQAMLDIHQRFLKKMEILAQPSAQKAAP